MDGRITEINETRDSENQQDIGVGGEVHDSEEVKKQESSIVSFFKELPMLILIALVAAWVIKTLIVQPFYIPTTSMEPTFIKGDHVLVSKFIYRFTKPKQGDVIVFEYPLDPSVDYIKRVIAVDGQKFEIRDGKSYLDGKMLKEDYLPNKSGLSSDFEPVIVPKDKLFVMGDNRNNSADSRVWGMLPKKNVLGRAFVIYWPIPRISLIK